MAGQYTDLCTLYKPTQSVDPVSLSVVPTAVVLVGTILGNLHRNTENALAAISSLGIYNVTPGHFYTSIDNAPILTNRCVLKIPTGTDIQYWAVVGKPAYRARFGATAHLKAIMILLNSPPLGVT